MNSDSNISGIILAGGKSTRMGTDKGLINWNGKPFVQHIIDALTPYTGEIIVVSSNKAYDDFDVRRVDDLISNSGPLAGVYTGLQYSETDLNLVLSCDVPLIRSEVLKKLIEADEADIDIIQFRHKDNTTPLIALYKKRCAARFLSLLKQGEKRLRTAVDQSKTVIIDPDNAWEHMLSNVNTPNELNEISHEIEH